MFFNIRHKWPKYLTKRNFIRSVMYEMKTLEELLVNNRFNVMHVNHLVLKLSLIVESIIDHFTKIFNRR